MAGILTAVGIGLAVAGSTAQIISGETKRVRAKRALEGFQRQELKNITKNLRVSTLGAELQTQEAQRRFATSVDALRSGGVRGVVGGLGQQEAQQQNLQQQISADLDRQQIQIDRLAAEDDIRIRQMIEQRESGQIAGLGAEMAAGSRTVQAGIGGLASAGVAGAQIAGLGGFGELGKGAKALSTAGNALDTANKGIGTISNLDAAAKGIWGGGAQMAPVQAKLLPTNSPLGRGGSFTRGTVDLSDRGDFGNLYGFDNSNNPYQ